MLGPPAKMRKPARSTAESAMKRPTPSSSPNGSTAGRRHDQRKARMTISDRIRVKSIRPLSNGHFKLNAVSLDWRRDNGEWQSQNREVLDRGDACTLLPYNLAQRSGVLVKQFRSPAYTAGHDDLLIEAAAGLLDNASPEERIRLEAAEETGYRLHAVR